MELEDIMDALEEFYEAFLDFIEDIFGKEPKELKKISFYGAPLMVRPAYLFAQWVDSLLKVIFGISIFISGLIATFWGYPRLSNLMEALIGSVWGRILIAIIGLSYFVLGWWKLTNIKEK